ncbi:MAG: molybdate ABC transporter substrate-binding protein [Candidatus Nanopelagicales bacterium]
MIRAAMAAVAATLALAGCGSPAAGPPDSVVRVAAASDLAFALDGLADLLAAEHPGIELRVTYGSSGQFAQQLRNGAPFDLFLSADSAYVDVLVADGLARRQDAFAYAVGRLVTWYPSLPPPDPGIAGLAHPSIRTVANATPPPAPSGRAAMAALDSAGLGAAVGPKLVRGENVAQAAEFARTGNADAAIIALSLVVAGPLSDQGTWAEVPLDLYPRLEQSGVVLAAAEDRASAEAVRDLILSEQGRQVLQRFGFSLPDESP